MPVLFEQKSLLLRSILLFLEKVLAKLNHTEGWPKARVEDRAISHVSCWWGAWIWVAVEEDLLTIVRKKAEAWPSREKILHARERRAKKEDVHERKTLCFTRPFPADLSCTSLHQFHDILTGAPPTGYSSHPLSWPASTKNGCPIYAKLGIRVLTVLFDRYDAISLRSEAAINPRPYSYQLFSRKDDIFLLH